MTSLRDISFSRSQKLALAAIAGITLVGLSVGYHRRHIAPETGPVVFHEASSGSASSGTANQASVSDRVVFQVAGRVRTPGVYELPAGSRVIDAVRAAGGAEENADLESMNLAAHIQDGERIYVPARGEMAGTSAQPVTLAADIEAPQAARGRSGSGAQKLRAPGEGFVNINTADETELQRLPGVGPATARKIIDYRSQIGRFRSPEQLIDVKGIGPKTFERMRPFVRI